MKIKLLSPLFFLLFSLFAFANDSVSQPEIVINNRILATVNGKDISVIDVMKRMDFYISRAYPEEAKSNMARFQFFTQNWRQTLNQLIDNELMIADAQKIELKISDAEIREKIHERFGPNIITSLDALNLSFDEAWQLIYSEMAVQRMSWYRVHLQALNLIGPQDIKKAYQDHLVKNPPKEEWKYQVLSIRAKTQQLGNIYAQKAKAIIRNDSLPFENLAKTLKQGNDLDPGIQVSVSDEYTVLSKDLSESHKTILANLKPGTYSEPIPQVSRLDKSIVHRIFYLKEHTKNPPPKFDSMVDTLHDELVQEEISHLFPAYLDKLRKQFNFDEKQLDSIPRDFQPFSLH